MLDTPSLPLLSPGSLIATFSTMHICYSRLETVLSSVAEELLVRATCGIVHVASQNYMSPVPQYSTRKSLNGMSDSEDESNETGFSSN